VCLNTINQDSAHGITGVRATYSLQAIIMQPFDYVVGESKEEILGTTTAPVNSGSVEDDDDTTNEEEERRFFIMPFEDNQFGDCVAIDHCLHEPQTGILGERGGRCPALFGFLFVHSDGDHFRLRLPDAGGAVGRNTVLGLLLLSPRSDAGSEILRCQLSASSALLVAHDCA